MTLITITHLSSNCENAAIEQQKQLANQKDEMRQRQASKQSVGADRQNLDLKLNLIMGAKSKGQCLSQISTSDVEADQFSLNSASPSPHSSLTSPFSSASTGYEGSQQSISNNNNNNKENTSARTGCQNQAALLSTSMDNLTVDRTSSSLSSNSSGIHEPHKSPASIGVIREGFAELALTSGPNSLRKLSSNSSTGSSGCESLTPGSAPSTPVRKLSRIEHRQSLSDLGYGKIESYAKLQRLGKGTYATVYMGRSRLSNEMVALKEILKEHDEGAPCTAIREVSLLRLLRHNNIVTLHDICHTPKKLTLVFEYVGPDLYAYMRENNNLLSMHNIRVS